MIVFLLLLMRALWLPAEAAGCDHTYTWGAHTIASSGPLSVKQLSFVTASIADIDLHYEAFSGRSKKPSLLICITDMKKVVKSFYPAGSQKVLLGYYDENDGWAFVGPSSLAKCNTDLVHELVHEESLSALSIKQSEELAVKFEAFLKIKKGCG
jgi:hypothetical protein